MAIEITDSNFQQTVIEASHRVPVLVDFWAEWCGPCRMIGPVLEKLEREYGGRFVLGKLDTDRNPRFATQFGISSIPAVKLFLNGKVVDEFVGALPESRVRSFLDKNIPDPEVEALAEASRAHPVDAARGALDKGLTGNAAEEVFWKGAIALLSEERPDLDLMQQFLKAIPEVGSPYSDNRKYLLQFIQGTPGAAEMQHFRLCFEKGSEREALDYFLGRVEQTRGEERIREKDRLLACFFVLGNANPLVNEYRRKLSSLLF